MHFFLTLDSRAGVVGSVHDFSGKTFRHGLLAALAGEHDQPAQGQRLTAFRTDLNRDLIGRAANTASLDLQRGRNVGQSSLEHFVGILAGLFLDGIEGFVAHVLSDATLAVEHDLIDELGHNRGPMNRIRQHLALGYKTATGHSKYLQLDVIVSRKVWIAEASPDVGHPLPVGMRVSIARHRSRFRPTQPHPASARASSLFHRQALVRQKRFSG